MTPLNIYLLGICISCIITIVVIAMLYISEKVDINDIGAWFFTILVIGIFSWASVVFMVKLIIGDLIKKETK